VQRLRTGVVRPPHMKCWSIKQWHCTVTAVAVFKLTDRREGTNATTDFLLLLIFSWE